MCKDGKCHERAGQVRNVVISLGTAAREMSKLADHPHMVVKTSTYIAFVLSDPELTTMPGIEVIMEVYPTTTDDEIARKAGQLLEQLFGLPPTSDAPVDAETAQKVAETRASFETSARIAAQTHANGF